MVGKLIEYWDSDAYREGMIQQALSELSPEQRADAERQLGRRCS